MRIEAYYKVTFWWYVLILAMASQVLYIFSYFVVWMFFPEADKYYKVGLSVAIVIVIPLLLMLKYKRYAFDFSNNMVICHIYYFGIKMKTISIEFLEVEIDSETISFYVDQSHEEYLEIDIGLAWEETEYVSITMLNVRSGTILFNNKKTKREWYEMIYDPTPQAFFEQIKEYYERPRSRKNN